MLSGEGYVHETFSLKVLWILHSDVSVIFTEGVMDFTL